MFTTSDFENYCLRLGPDGVFDDFSKGRPSVNPVADFLMSHGVHIKPVARLVMFLYYEEVPGMGGSGKMDWSIFPYVQWLDYLRQSCIVWSQDRTKVTFVPGLRKSILHSQFRVHGIHGGNWNCLRPYNPAESKESVLIVKTDGSSLQYVWSPEKNEWFGCTNGSCMVGVEFVQAMNAACGEACDSLAFKTKILNHIRDKFGRNQHISVNLEIVGTRSLVTPHCPDSVYLNQVWTVREGMVSVAELELLRKDLCDIGVKAPYRFWTMVPTPASLEEFETLVTPDILDKAIRAELESSPVPESLMRTCFEGFVLKTFDLDLKWKTDLYCTINRVCHGKSVGSKELIVSVLERFQSHLGTLREKFPSFVENREIHHRTETLIDGALRSFVSDPTARKLFNQKVSGTMKQILEILDRLHSLSVLRLDLASLSRKEIFLQGFKNEFFDNDFSEKIRMVFHRFILCPNRQRLKMIKSLARSWKCSYLEAILCTESVLFDSETYTQTADGSEKESETDSLHQYMDYLKYKAEIVNDSSPDPVFLVDLDGTLLEAPGKGNHILCPWSSLSVRYRLRLTAAAGALSSICKACPNARIVLLTGAKLQDEDLETLCARRFPFFVHTVVSGHVSDYYGAPTVSASEQKKIFINLLNLKSRFVVLLDDNRHVWKGVSDMLPVIKVNETGSFGYVKDLPGQLPIQIVMFGPPGIGKSTFCKTVQEILPETVIFMNRDLARLAGKAEGNDEHNVSELVQNISLLMNTVHQRPVIILNDFMNIELRPMKRTGCIFLFPEWVLNQVPLLCWLPASRVRKILPMISQLLEMELERWTDMLCNGVRERINGNVIVESTFHEKRLLDGIHLELVMKSLATLASASDEKEGFGYEAAMFIPMREDLEIIRRAFPSTIRNLRDLIESSRTDLESGQRIKSVRNRKYKETDNPTESSTKGCFLSLRFEDGLHSTLSYQYSHTEAVAFLMEGIRNRFRTVTIPGTGEFESNEGKWKWEHINPSDEDRTLWSRNHCPHITVSCPKGLGSKCNELSRSEKMIPCEDLCKTGQLWAQ